MLFLGYKNIYNFVIFLYFVFYIFLCIVLCFFLNICYKEAKEDNSPVDADSIHWDHIGA